ncbi:IS3 family transposase [Gleimia hominis]|uniref:IS3 family transposase n=1 Tax=Gleimia hominis TaxID=595468 RepID=UPI003DA8E3D0
MIHTRRWNDVLEVEIATFEWVTWWNTGRLHNKLDYRTPCEVENEYWQQHKPAGIIRNKVKTKEGNPHHFVGSSDWSLPCF